MHLFSPFNTLFLSHSKPVLTPPFRQGFGPFIFFVILQHDICYEITATHSMTMDPKNFSQFTFDFSDAAQPQENASVGVRVKSLKPVEPLKEEEPITATTVAPAPAKPVVKKSTRGRKSLKALDAEADLVNIPADELLFRR